jgi:hypothetical protein
VPFQSGDFDFNFGAAPSDPTNAFGHFAGLKSFPKLWHLPNLGICRWLFCF